MSRNFAMRRGALGAALGLGLLAAGHVWAEAPSAMAGEIDRVAEKAVADGETIGLQVAVIRDGREVISKGYGLANVEQNTRVTPETGFRVGSVSKQITAAAILLLAEDGKLSIDDPVAKVFPDFPRSGEVTIRQLLGHTSGLHNFTDNPPDVRDYQAGQTTDQRVDLIARQAVVYDFEPGTRWSYSNSGYYLLGAIVEKVSGQTFGAFLKARIFDRLGMGHTALDDDLDVVPGRAAGYDLGDEAPYRVRNAPFAQMPIYGGAGALRSTASDIARWQDALFNGRVLKPDSLRQMIDPVRLKGGKLASADPEGMLAKMKLFEGGFGLMLFKADGFDKVGHGGGLPGFTASADTFRKAHATVVVLSNTTGGPAMAGVGKSAPAIEAIAAR
jgi:D-alanyl-D-alanine carboxypeptidase